MWQLLAPLALNMVAKQQEKIAAKSKEDELAHQMRVAEMLRQREAYDDRSAALTRVLPPQFEGGYQ